MTSRVAQRLALQVVAAADLLRISTDALMRKARAGKVPGVRIGRQWVIIEEDLLAFVRIQAQERARGVRCKETVLSDLRVRPSSLVGRLDAAQARQLELPTKRSGPK
jgi:excisionase family DNA binding protein